MSPEITPIASVAAGAPTALSEPAAIAGQRAVGAEAPDFAALMRAGVVEVERRVENANGLVRAFVTDESVPVHQVAIALEEARLAVEFAVQVRNRLVEGYREIMNMQL